MTQQIIASTVAAAAAVRLATNSRGDSRAALVAGVLGFWAGGQVYKMIAAPTAVTSETDNSQEEPILEWTVTDD